MTEKKKLWQGVTDFFSERSRMTDTMYGRGVERERRTEINAWAPMTDILSRGDDLVIRCEVPGVVREDVDIAFAGGVLTISGIRQTEQGEDNWGYYVRERYYGHFRRVISLPEGVSEADIDAVFTNGLLVVTVVGGAASTGRSHQINIQGDGS